MNTLIEQTTVRCQQCSERHSASIERVNGQVYGKADCPRHPAPILLSSNADLYLALRKKSRRTSLSPSNPPAPLLTLLPITDQCNFRCPICYADSGPKSNPEHLDLEEVVRRARAAKTKGAKTVSLTGGEPTLHPDLLNIIRAVHRLGVRVYLVTNGLRLGKEPGLAIALRQAGLAKVKLQLDSFKPATHEQLRGNVFINEKIQAARNVIQAGLRLGTITTVTQLNISEIGQIIEFGLSLAPGLNTIVFQAAAAAGRFDLSQHHLVDKEEILTELLACGKVPGASLRDVWPLPHVEPWGMRVDPDCGVNLLMLMENGRAQLASEFVDLEKMQERLHALPSSADWWSRNLKPLGCILGSTRKGRRLAVLRSLLGFLFGGKSHGLVVIGVGSFCHPKFLDERRLAGCATSELTQAGGVCPCEWHSQVP